MTSSMIHYKTPNQSKDNFQWKKSKKMSIDRAVTNASSGWENEIK